MVHPGTATQNFYSSPNPLAGKRLLLVNDQVIDRTLVLQIADWGIVFERVVSGQAALHVLRQKTFDLVVLDLQLPESDRQAVIAQMRQQPGYASLPIVVFNADRRVNYVDGCLAHSSEAGSAGSSTVQFFQSSPTICYLPQAVPIEQFHAVLCRVLTGTQPANPPAASAPITAQPSEFAGLRILLAEDSLVNQKLGLLLLKKMGHQADLANNGLEVLEALQHQVYDVVLMDVQMPKMDGLEATRQIDRQQLAQRPYIIAMTASAMRGDREACLEAGMNDYVCKPIQIEALEAALKRVPRSAKSLG